MFTACFDASGKIHDQEHLVVAGFVAHASVWMDFDKAWRSRLEKEGKSYFHRSDYGKVKAGTPREVFFSDLVTIIRRHAPQKFGCIIPLKLLERKLSPEIREHFFLHAYVFASLVSLSQVEKWAKREFITTPIKAVFEEGDDGAGLLIKAMSQSGWSAPVFKKKKDAVGPTGSIPAFTPIQAADFLAYELFQLGKHILNQTEDFSRALEEFKEMPGEAFYLTESDLDQYEETFVLQKVTYEWAKEKLS